MDEFTVDLMTFMAGTTRQSWLGRRVEFDERSRGYPARGTLFRDGDPYRTKTWRRPRPYDQGGSSTCVGFTWLGMVNTQPYLKQWPLKQRRMLTGTSIYRWAQMNDEWPGEEPAYYGTSVLAGAKALLSLVEADPEPVYRWCFGLRDVRMTLGYHGPVAIGVNWYESMFTPGRRGLLSVGGEVVGGHAVELIGVDEARGEVIGVNSWGVTWGPAFGRFRLTFGDLDRLLHEDGEAVTLS